MTVLPLPVDEATPGAARAEGLRLGCACAPSPEGERQRRMWDRAWIRDAVVATTVRVGVRTPVALRMCPARRTFYAALRRVPSRRPACSSLRTNNPATAVSSCSANPVAGRLESLNRLRVVGVFKPTTNDDGLCDHDSRRFLRVLASVL